MALKALGTRSMTGYNKVQISLTEDLDADQFKNRYIAFIKGIEAKKTDKGIAFDYQSAINFKMDAEDLFALGYAAEKFAAGQGASFEKTFGNFTKFADAGKSNHGEGGSQPKTLSLAQKVNEKNNLTNINLYFKGNGKTVGIMFTPYSLYAFSQICYDYARRIFDLESKRSGIQVSGQATDASGFEAPRSAPQQQPQRKPVSAPPMDGGFGNVEANFNNTLNGMADAPGFEDAPF